MNKLFNKVAVAFVGIAMAIGVGVAVGARQEVEMVSALDSSTSYTYSGKGTTWTGTNFEDADDYWKSSASSDSVASVSGLFSGKTITSDVVITLDVACFGSGDNPTSSKFSIYADSSCSTSVASTQSGTLPSSKTYTSAVYTVAKNEATSKFANDIAIKIASGTKVIRFRSFTIEFSYTAGGPTVSISNATISGKIGDSVTLECTDTGTGSFANKNVVWSVPASSIAVIEGNTLTFVKNGDDVLVTATLRDGEEVKATDTKLTSLSKPSVSIKESGEAKTNIIVSTGDSFTLDKATTNAPSSNVSYVWSHSGTAGTFNTSTLVYTATGSGIDTITLSMKYNDTVIATSTLRVKIGSSIDQSQGAYHLISNTSELYTGAHITLLNAGHTYGLGAAKTSNYGASAVTYDSGSTSVVKTNDKDTLTDIELEKEGDYWRFCVGTNSYLYASSSSANQLKASTLATVGDNGLWSITITNGVFAIAAQGTNTRDDLFYNPNNGSPLFACYDGSAPSGGSTVAIYLYKTYESETSAFATAFIKGDDSSNTCAKTIENWSTHKTNFAKLSAGARNIFANATHDEISTYDGSTSYTVANCVARYDDAVKKNASLQTSENEFMGRVASGQLSYARSDITLFSHTQSDSTTLIIVVVSFVSLTAIGGYFLLKKRKENN